MERTRFLVVDDIRTVVVPAPKHHPSATSAEILVSGLVMTTVVTDNDELKPADSEDQWNSSGF